MTEDVLRHLESRVARIEEELTQIKAQLVEKSRRAFEALASIHEGDKVFEEIVREGRKTREADRAAARKADDLAKGKERTKKRAGPKTRQVGKRG